MMFSVGSLLLLWSCLLLGLDLGSGACPSNCNSPTPRPPTPLPTPLPPTPLPTQQPTFAPIKASPSIPAGGQCVSPVQASSTLGCVDFVQTTMQALDLVASTIDAHGVGGDSDFLNQFFRPVLSALRQSLGQTFPGLNANVCFGNFRGSTITDAPMTGFNSALYVDKCTKVPVAADGEYMVFSFSIPVPMLSCDAFAASSKAGAMASMCMVLSLCGSDQLPTLGFAFDKGMFGCLFGNDALVAASGGISYVVSQISYQTMESTSTSLSISDNLEKSIVLYDTYGLVNAKVHANLATSMEFSLASDKIGLPPYLKLEGNLWLMVALFGDPQRSTVFAHTVTNFDSFLTGLRDDFSIAVTGQANLVFLLKEMSRGVFPDLKFNMGTASALISSATKANAGVEPGFYLYVQGNNLEAAIVTSIIKTILPLVDQIIDATFGKGATAAFVKYAAPDDTSSTKLGLGINAVQAGIYLQVPVGAAMKAIPPFNFIPGIEGFFGALEFDMRIRLSDGAVSFYVNYLMSGYMTLMWKDLLLVWNAAEKFFEDTGKVIAAVAQEALVFTEHEIEKCAEDIVNGVYEVEGELQNWAQQTIGICGSYEVDQKLPTSCPDGWDQDGAVCYEKCRSGFYGVGPVCYASCPAGWDDQGLVCAAHTYAPGSCAIQCKTHSDWSTTCDCPSNKPHNCASVCYENCRDGYSMPSSACGFCKANGSCPSGTTNVAGVCWKDSYGRGAGVPLGCSSGYENFLGICYASCKSGYSKVAGLPNICFAAC